MCVCVCKHVYLSVRRRVAMCVYVCVCVSECVRGYVCLSMFVKIRVGDL